MPTQLIRAQVMLDPEDYRRLQALANETGKSLSAILREAVLRFLEEQEQQKQEQLCKTLAEMRQIREQNATRYGVYQGDLVNEAREERERQMEDVQKLESEPSKQDAWETLYQAGSLLEWKTQRTTKELLDEVRG